MTILILLVAIALAWWLVRRYRRQPVVPPGWELAAPDEFVVVDLETTGLNGATDHIVEIGALKVRREQMLEAKPTIAVFATLVKPPVPVPAQTTSLTGISQAMVDADGVAVHAALTGFQEFAGDLPLIAFNAKFDRSFLLAAGRRSGVEFSNEWVCALELARRALPGMKSYKLSDLTSSLGNQDHRALEDARRALLVYALSLQARHSDR